MQSHSTSLRPIAAHNCPSWAHRGSFPIGSQQIYRFNCSFISEAAVGRYAQHVRVENKGWDTTVFSSAGTVLPGLVSDS